MPFVCHSYLRCTRMSSVCHSYVTRMSPCVIRMSLICIRTYVFVCHSYVTRMYSHVIRMSLVCTLMSSVSVFHSYVVLPWTNITVNVNFIAIWQTVTILQNYITCYYALTSFFMTIFVKIWLNWNITFYVFFRSLLAWGIPKTP